MALIIEDGTIVANANSYITVDQYVTWADARFGCDRSTAKTSDADVEALILRAMDYFESQSFKGLKATITQDLQWPRSDVVIDNYYVDAATIPKEVKNSIYELAYAEEVGNSELSTIDRKVSREKVASIEVEYADSSSSTTINRAIPNAMKKLLYGGGMMRVRRI